MYAGTLQSSAKNVLLGCLVPVHEPRQYAACDLIPRTFAAAPANLVCAVGQLRL